LFIAGFDRDPGTFHQKPSVDVTGVVSVMNTLEILLLYVSGSNISRRNVSTDPGT
jgi:hypothetical protein